MAKKQSVMEVIVYIRGPKSEIITFSAATLEQATAKRESIIKDGFEVGEIDQTDGSGDLVYYPPCEIYRIKIISKEKERGEKE